VEDTALGVKRQHRNHDPETNQIDEDSDEDDQQRGSLHLCVAISDDLKIPSEELFEPFNYKCI
jgi:hypothetical protein